MIKELDREADDFIICDNSLVLVGHLSSVLIRSIRGYQNKNKNYVTALKELTLNT